MNRYLPSLFTGSDDAEAEQQPPEAPVNPQEDQRLTRARAAATGISLTLPVGVGRGARRAGSRSPSPLPNPGGSFFPGNMPNSEAEDERTRQMMQAAVAAAMSAMQNMDISRRKPELPSFDSKNIEIWIKRVESAYARSNVTKPKDKFAFLESKIGVDQDAKINEFLFGEATDAKWAEFLDYLRSRYGRTVKQECSSILDGITRDGRRPSEMLAHIRDRAGKITIDDLFKEMVLRSLPSDIQRSIADKTDTMTADEAVKLADVFFDKDGQPLHSNSSNSVSSVEKPPPSGEEEEEDDSINAINRHQRSQPKGRPGFQNQNRGKHPASNQQRHPQKKKSSLLCFAHVKFGDDAYTCEEGCKRYGQPLAKRPGNDQAGRRT